MQLYSFVSRRHKPIHGFTLVELLIVIVVIAILAAISVGIFNGVQQRSRNSARLSEHNAWVKALRNYVTQESTAPATVGTWYCLGDGFKDYTGDGVGDCWDVVRPMGGTSGVTENTAFKTNITKVVTSLPKGTREPIIGGGGYLRIGPAVMWTSGKMYVVSWFEGAGTDACPIGLKAWSDAVTIQCREEIVINP